MADDSGAALTATRREPAGSRDARRLRREGAVPGILYGGGKDPVAFSVDGRDLRHALHHGGAVIDLKLQGSAGPVVLKELVRHPVSGDYTHVDLMRVRLDRPIQAPVTLELTGAENAPGVKEGGVLEHLLREITVEALPTEIPNSLECDVSAMVIGDTLTLAAVTAPAGVKILTEEETLVATLTPPRLKTVEEEEAEIEAETEVVGEGEGAAEGAPEEAEQASEGDSGDAE
jgi:large subunit ribosomal protein L25